MTVASNLSKTTQTKPACHGIPDGTPANPKNKKALNNQGFRVVTWRRVRDSITLNQSYYKSKTYKIVK